MATLLSRLEAAGRGEGGVVLVGGEPGIGKTRLMQALTERAAAQAWTVLVGRAYEAEGQPPYLPFVEALRDYIRTCPLDALGTQIGRGDAQLALLLPDLAGRIPDLPPGPTLSPEAERYRLFESVADFLLAVANGPTFDARGSPLDAGEATGSNIGPRPAHGLLLALDDLQWADTPTLLLLEHLARRLVGVPVLIAGTYRTVGLEPGHPFSRTLAELRREGLDERVLLGPLALDDVADLIGGLTGVVPTAEVAKAVDRETDGNAFFIGELVRHLLMEGRDLTDPESAVAAWGIPAGVREVISARLARLSAAANQLLQVAAVLGDDLTFEVLASASGLPVAACMDAMDEALLAGMLHERGAGYQFSHALVRQTLYEGLPLHRRQGLHLRVAAALEATTPRDRGAPLAALAAHYRLAGPAADPQKALTYSHQAGDAAAAVLAWEEAVRHWQAALELLGPERNAFPTMHEDQRCELLLALGAAQKQAGDAVAQATFQRACDRARTLQAPELFAQGALGHGELVTGYNIGGVAQKTVDLLEEALQLVGEEPAALRARLQSCLAWNLYYADDPGRRAALSDSAVAAARRADDPATLAYVLSRHHETLKSLRRHDAQLAVADELVQLGERLQDSEILRQGQFWRVTDLLEAGDIAAAGVALDAHARLAQEQRLPFYQVVTVQWRAVWALLGGRLDESDRLADEAFAPWQQAPREARIPWLLLHGVALRRAQGRLAEVEETALEMADRRPIASTFRTLPAYIHSLTGRETEAREEFEALAAHDFAGVLGSSYTISVVTYLAETCAVLRDRERAPRLYGLLVPFAGRNAVGWAWPHFRGAVDHYLGLLAATMGEWDTAARHFDVALAMHERVGARPYLARTQHAYAAMLLERRRAADQPRARSLLGEAVVAFDEIGMAQDAAEARVLLAGPRAAAASPRPTFPGGLSEREVEVLRLIAAGKGNQEIADALVISRNTVLRHVNHIYAKTGAANRVELANYAHRQNLSG